MADQDQIDVLHVIGTLSPGGAERNLFYLAPYMARSKSRYGIACLFGRGELARQIQDLGIPVFDLGHRQRYIVRSVVRLYRLLKSAHVRVLHTHLYESGLVGRLAAWMAGTPVIVTHEHGKTLWKHWYHRWFERLAQRRTDLRLAVSQDILELRKRHEHTPPEKIRLVFNAVDPSQFDLDDSIRRQKRQDLGISNCFVIGTVGRLVEAKSYDLLLEAARDVCSKKPDLRFILAGEGHLAESLKQLRDSYGLADKFLFLGLRSDIPELMAAMDLYIITSKREGLPLSLIEAMMSAKPIVSTAVGGIPDTITHSCDGLLVPAGDCHALVQALESLIDNPSRMQTLGQNARKTAVEKYSPQKILDQIEHIYDEILTKKQPGRRGSELKT